MNIQCAERFAQAVAPASTDQGHDIRALRRYPRDGHLCDGCADAIRCAAQLLDQGKISVEVRALEARAVGTPITLSGARLGPMAADQTAGKHTIGGDADSKLPRHRQDLVFNSA